jgi:DNA-binding MarR family transcriptional regulator
MKDANTPAFHLEEFTPYRLARAAQLMSDAFAETYRKRFGLSVSDWRVLVHVSDIDTAKGGSASIRDIEARVGMEKSKVSRAASRLVARGLLTKTTSTSDKRLVSLSLTDQGAALMAELLPLARAFQNKIEAELGASLSALDRGLDAVLARDMDRPGDAD